jgi:DNA-binding XRE family transcriptional regulator/predicted RNase H-like HicB family nuclease
MRYIAYISREGKRVLAEFPDCPGCQTYADHDEAIAEVAREALEGWLEAHLVDGQIPPRPSIHYGAPHASTMARISIRPGLAAALNIRWARNDAGLSQKALGERAGVSQQQIAKLEDPDENPSLDTLSKVGAALGLHVNLDFEPSEEPSLSRLGLRQASRASERHPAPPPARGSRRR